MSPLERAAATLAARLEIDAATEIADAFNDEYDTETHALAVRHERETTVYALPLKLWDATLDTRLCPTCAGLMGTVRPWGFDFPARMPAHPRCRCRAATVLPAGVTTNPPRYGRMQ